MTRCIVMLVAIFMPSVLWAQETTRSWPGFDASGLSTVYIRDDTGDETEGRFLRLEPASVVILAGETERRIAADRIQRIQKRGDSLRNGAVWGAVVGAVVGVLGAGLSDCPGDNPSGPCPGARTALFAVSTGLYSAIGTGIDALVTGRTTLYEATTTPLSFYRTPAGSRTSDERPIVVVSFRW